jgi:hypothetical protein
MGADPLAEARDGGGGRSMSGETYEAPGLPNPPEPSMRPQAKLLDTSPSPRIDGLQPAFVGESPARTRLGVEPARNRIGPSGPGQAIAEAPPLPIGVRAVAAEQTQPARLPPLKPQSNAPVLILILVLVAAAGAAVWFFILRPQAQVRDVETSQTTPGSATAGSATAGSATPGTATGSAATAGSPTGSNAPKAEMLDTVIGSIAEGARVEIVGTDQSGPAPFTAKLENGRAYKARIIARGFATLELDLKGGDDKVTAKLVAKPRVITIDSDPPGAAIWIDSAATGHSTPTEVDLTAAQAAKKTVRVQLRKSGFRTVDRVIDLAKLTEDDTRMVMKIDEKLAVPTPPTSGSRAGSAAGAAKGSAHDGSDASAGSGSAPTTDSATAPAGGSAQPPGTSGSAASPPAATTPPAPTPPAPEPEPEFNKKP